VEATCTVRIGVECREAWSARKSTRGRALEMMTAMGDHEGGRLAVVAYAIDIAAA
jgi:hypothetical protein